MEAMFQQAFTERGASGGRPTAKQWETALDSVRSRLKKCNSSGVHVYPNHLPNCPWCALEQQGVVYFIDVGTTYNTTANGFNLIQVWAQIESVPAPSPISLPNIARIQVTPSPLPAGIPGAGTTFFFRSVVVCIAVFLFMSAPKLWFLIAIGAWIGWAVAGSSGSEEREAELSKRKAAESVARNTFNGLVERIKKEAGPDGFQQKKDEYKKLREELQALPARESQELSKLHSTAQERQKQKFLERFFIDAADIPGVGPSRKAALRSFGIETAADVTRSRVMQIKGFGESLTRAVTDWKASVERRFVFNPVTAVSEADKNGVRAKIGARKNAISTTLSEAATELQHFRKMAVSRASALQPQLDQAAKQLAQAQSDLSVF
jgi:DNA-binding helix-hairpin-helix protein with protein kinase domain